MPKLNIKLLYTQNVRRKKNTMFSYILYEYFLFYTGRLLATKS